MKSFKKHLPSFLALTSLVATAFLYSQPSLLFIVLLALGMIHLWAYWSPGHLKLYIFSFFLGALAEAFAIYFGAWTYPFPDIIGVPFWLAPLWGLAGTYLHFMGTEVFDISKKNK